LPAPLPGGYAYGLKPPGNEGLGLFCKYKPVNVKLPDSNQDNHIEFANSILYKELAIEPVFTLLPNSLSCKEIRISMRLSRPQ
jgi:predicted DNA binding CopG/RHH family protein